ncbi:hypothetical protein HK105_207950 [Polyrhizophydium stewartii]|uniref:Uncharacterized protein n=1 Tax=Polyrhizophydium stewartii TaxID=2732419 RepID=A0ABR4MZ55_9FUNG
MFQPRAQSPGGGTAHAAEDTDDGAQGYAGGSSPSLMRRLRSRVESGLARLRGKPRAPSPHPEDPQAAPATPPRWRSLFQRRSHSDLRKAAGSPPPPVAASQSSSLPSLPSTLPRVHGLLQRRSNTELKLAAAVSQTPSDQQAPAPAAAMLPRMRSAGERPSSSELRRASLSSTQPAAGLEDPVGTPASLIAADEDAARDLMLACRGAEPAAAIATDEAQPVPSASPAGDTPLSPIDAGDAARPAGPTSADISKDLAGDPEPTAGRTSPLPLREGSLTPIPSLASTSLLGSEPMSEIVEIIETIKTVEVTKKIRMVRLVDNPSAHACAEHQHHPLSSSTPSLTKAPLSSDSAAAADSSPSLASLGADAADQQGTEEIIETIQTVMTTVSTTTSSRTYESPSKPVRKEIRAFRSAVDEAITAAERQQEDMTHPHAPPPNPDPPEYAAFVGPASAEPAAPASASGMSLPLETDEAAVEAVAQVKEASDVGHVATAPTPVLEIVAKPATEPAVEPAVEPVVVVEIFLAAVSEPIADPAVKTAIEEILEPAAGGVAAKPMDAETLELTTKSAEETPAAVEPLDNPATDLADMSGDDRDARLAKPPTLEPTIGSATDLALDGALGAAAELENRPVAEIDDDAGVEVVAHVPVELPASPSIEVAFEPVVEALSHDSVDALLASEAESAVGPAIVPAVEITIESVAESASKSHVVGIATSQPSRNVAMECVGSETVTVAAVVGVAPEAPSATTELVVVQDAGAHSEAANGSLISPPLTPAHDETYDSTVGSTLADSGVMLDEGTPSSLLGLRGGSGAFLEPKPLSRSASTRSARSMHAFATTQSSGRLSHDEGDGSANAERPHQRRMSLHICEDTDKHFEIVVRPKASKMVDSSSTYAASPWLGTSRLWRPTLFAYLTRLIPKPTLGAVLGRTSGLMTGQVIFNTLRRPRMGRRASH